MQLLLGWQYNISTLKTPIPGLVSMNPLTAFCFIVVAVSFLLLASPGYHSTKTILGKALAAAVATVSVMRLLQSVTTLLPRLEHVFFTQNIEHDAQNTLANGMAINTAICFLLSSAALFMLKPGNRSKVVAGHAFAVVVFFVSFVSIIGYIYQAPEYYDLLRHLPMAIHTAVCFSLFSFAVLLTNPYQGLSGHFTGPHSGSLVGRLLLPAAFVIPMTAGYIRIVLYQKNWFSDQLGTALLILAIIIVKCGSIVHSVLLLNKKDILQKQTEDALQETRESFRSLVTSIKDYAIFIVDLEGNILSWNQGAETIKGYGEIEVIGKHFSLFYIKEDIENNVPQKLLFVARQKGRVQTEGWRIKKDGSRFWADVTITALHNKMGEMVGFAKVTRDMTEAKQAKDVLTNFNAELSRQVKSQTQLLEQTTVQLRQLSSHLQSAREDERKFVAREMHDELGQMLTGLRMDVVWLKKHVINNAEGVKERLDSTLELLNETRQTVRRISSNLHPAILEDLGLVAALKFYSEDFQNRSGIKINFSTILGEQIEATIPPEDSIALYRIFQEALTNVANHAQATVVDAFLRTSNNYIVLGISDNGKGFSEQDVAGKKSLGLVSIRERALVMDGRYEIHSVPGEGTTIIINVPLKQK